MVHRQTSKKSHMLKISPRLICIALFSAIIIMLIMTNVDLYFGGIVMIGMVGWSWGTLILVLCIAFIFPILYTQMKGD